MSSHRIAEPEAETATIFDRRSEVRVAFLGRLKGVSTRPSTAEAARQAFETKCHTGPARLSAEQMVVVNQQVHSSRVVSVEEAPAEADGLFVGPSAESRPPEERFAADHPVDERSTGGVLSLALTIFTADCVPVLLGHPRGPIAALHAGWRGLAGGIIGEGVARFAEPAQVTAWIGPCIGACCYEVDDEVALAVARRSDASVVRPGRHERPHLDLERAARLQLQADGVRDVRIMRRCTRCDPSWHSYRREGAGKGRNHAFIWRDPPL